MASGSSAAASSGAAQKGSPAAGPKGSPAAAPAEAIPDGNIHMKVIAGKFDFQKSYARRRPDEPKSHYNTRVKFIQALLKEQGNVLTDERIEVLSHCFSNVKYLDNKYPGDIMDTIAKYDPTIQHHDDDEPTTKKRKVDKKSASSGEEADEGEARGKKEANGTTSPKQSPKTKADEGAKGSPSPKGSPKGGAKTAQANAAALLAAAAEEDSD
eukprot:g19992.t1